MESLSHRDLKEVRPELFIGIVGAVGTELDRISALLCQSLERVRYSCSRIRLATLIRALPKYKTLPTKFVDEYIDSHMTAGDELRRLLGRNDAVGLLGITDIMAQRKEAAKAFGEIIEGRAFIIRSLKHPEEIETFRNIYGRSFYLVAAYSSYNQRRTYLAKRIAKTRNQYPFERHFGVADHLMFRDQEEVGTEHGQHTRESFHQADIFLDMADGLRLRAAIERFVELIFGNTFHTPTRAEYAMFHARAAALRSAELGRQVGASIATTEGVIVAVGSNDVPKAGGGLYWCEDKPDKREFQIGMDSSDEQKRDLVAETLSILQQAGWLSESRSRSDVDELVRVALDRKSPVIPKDAKIRNIIEYGRAVHAEMAALADAARRGISVSGCEMFVTTFPCHLCARQIVAAGISKLVYVEPYAKSLAAELYPDSIAVDGSDRNSSRVPFAPFVGVAPRQYMDLFAMRKRKSSDGTAIDFSPATAKLRYHENQRIYLENEDASVKNLRDRMKACGILD